MGRPSGPPSGICHRFEEFMDLLHRRNNQPAMPQIRTRFVHLSLLAVAEVEFCAFYNKESQLQGSEMKTIHIASLCVAVAGLSAPALAADPMAPLYSPTPVTGYVDLHGGPGWGNDDFGGGHTDTFTEGLFGGSGHAALQVSPTMSVQGDIWTDTFSGKVDYSSGSSDNYSTVYGGAAGHMLWGPSTDTSFGIFGSIGAASGTYRSASTYGTAGIEAVHNAGQLRLYGQAGATFGVTGYASDYASKDIYARGVLAYYLTPVLALSGNLGYDHYTSSDWGGAKQNEVLWGARLEYKPADWPVSTYLGYEGWHYDYTDNYPSKSNGTEHVVVAGIRIPFGGMSVQGTDRSAGLQDMNPTYGQISVH